MNAAAETETESADAELAISDRGDPARTNSAEHIFRFMHHLVSATAQPQWLKRIDYWSRHTATLRAGDFVFCEPADRSWWAVIRVLEVCGEGLVVEDVVGRETMRYAAPPAIKRGPLGTNDDDFTIERSEEAIGKFCVVRKHDKLVMTKGQPFNKGQCVDWLRQYLVTVRR